MPDERENRRAGSGGGEEEEVRKGERGKRGKQEVGNGRGGRVKMRERKW